MQVPWRPPLAATACTPLREAGARRPHLGWARPRNRNTAPAAPAVEPGAGQAARGVLPFPEIGHGKRLLAVAKRAEQSDQPDRTSAVATALATPLPRSPHRGPPALLGRAQADGCFVAATRLPPSPDGRGRQPRAGSRPRVGTVRRSRHAEAAPRLRWPHRRIRAWVRRRGATSIGAKIVLTRRGWA